MTETFFNLFYLDRLSEMFAVLTSLLDYLGDRGGTVVKVLCHKSEGRWFNPS